MFELIIKQKVKSYTEDHRFYSENLDELLEIMKLSIKLSKDEVYFLIREYKEEQIEDEE